MRRLPAKILSPFLQRFVKFYFKKPRNYSYKAIKGKVNPGVFFPHFTISTRMLMDFISPKDLKNKSFLELGCGTGFISVMAAKKGADVTASDINEAAVENAKQNAESNGVALNAIQSDLFENIDSQTFDYIIINPPYYPKNAQNREEEAWFCGANFEYFQKLFPQLTNYFDANSSVYMILSEDCDFDQIEAIAKKNHISFKVVHKKKKYGEISYIYEIT